MQNDFYLNYAIQKEFDVLMIHRFFLRIWNFENVEKKPWRTLAHPSYVYCARFHPIVEEYVVTAGYDKIIRVWSMQKKHGTVDLHIGDESIIFV